MRFLLELAVSIIIDFPRLFSGIKRVNWDDWVGPKEFNLLQKSESQEVFMKRENENTVFVLLLCLCSLSPICLFSSDADFYFTVEKIMGKSGVVRADVARQSRDVRGGINRREYNNRKKSTLTLNPDKNATSFQVHLQRCR